MNKILFCFTIFFTSSFFILQAQSYSFGVKVGINHAGIGNDGIDLAPRLMGGIYSNIAMDDKFSIQPEIQISQQGTNRSLNIFTLAFVAPFGGEVKTFDLSYLNIPVMAQYKVYRGIFFEFGPQLGILLNAKADFSSKNKETETNVTDSFNPLDASLAFGLGVKFRGGFSMNTRYYLGLTDISKNKTGESLYNRVLQFSLGHNIIKPKN